MFRISETPKLSNKGIFMLLFNCRKRRSNSQNFSLHLTNHRFSHRLPCLTYFFNAFATIVCWDPRIPILPRDLFFELFTRNLFFCDRKVCLIIIFQFAYFRARAHNGVSGLLFLCWKMFGKPYYWKETCQ